MFTGIIESVGKVLKIEGNVFTFSHDFDEKEETFEIGESISLSGMCGTIIRFDLGSFDIEIIEQSRNLTHFGSILVGESVNLERSAKIGSRNSGHHVLGHVDGLFPITKIQKVGDYWRFWVQLEEKCMKYVVDKGSIALDGISLTISGVDKLQKSFHVSIIDHTYNKTTLKSKKKGDTFQIEFDYLAKLVVDR